MPKYAVANVADLPDGERLIVEIEGRSVGIFNLDGEYFALLDQCPHAGAALCSFGKISGVAKATQPDGEIDYQPGQSLRCPWHKWEFNIRTGESWYDPANARVRKYNVEVIEGSPEACVDLEQQGIQKGPHILEGYEVSVEDDVIVVDTSRARRGTQSDRARRVVVLPSDS